MSKVYVLYGKCAIQMTEEEARSSNAKYGIKGRTAERTEHSQGLPMPPPIQRRSTAFGTVVCTPVAKERTTVFHDRRSSPQDRKRISQDLWRRQKP